MHDSSLVLQNFKQLSICLAKGHQLRFCFRKHIGGLIRLFHFLILLLSLKSKRSANLRHLVKFVSIVCEGEGEKLGFLCKFGIPGSAPLAGNCSGEQGKVVGASLSAHGVKKPFCFFPERNDCRSCSVDSGCPSILASLAKGG